MKPLLTNNYPPIKIRKKRQRELAKQGLVATLASVVITGAMGKKKAHVASSVAFLGCALWHSSLYGNKRK